VVLVVKQDILRKAKQLGNFLLVGVHTDEAVNTVRGSHTNFPILNLHERYHYLFIIYWLSIDRMGQMPA
jgi:glycerol-3-phosphate cytidylyltransferase-like family protein